MGPDRRIDEFASRQYGVFSLEQARRAGITDRMVDSRLGGGAWIRFASGVYALASSRPSWERQMAAAVLSRPGSLVAGPSAAHLHGFEGFGPGRPVVMVPMEGNARSPIARVIRSRHFDTIVTVHTMGFLVTSPTETLVTLAGELGLPRLEALVDECLAAGLFEIETLMATIGRRPGTRGLPKLRRITEERLPQAYQPPTTVLERLLYRLLDHPAIPDVTRQFPFAREVVPGTVDAYIPEWRLITESDGRRWHTRKADFERDRIRDNQATAHGIGVLRFTYQMLTRTPDECLRLLLETGRTRSRAS